MPVTTTLTQSLAGVSLNHAMHGETVLLSTSAYLSSDDGSTMVRHLEAVWSCFQEALAPTKILPSQVDTFLALIDRNNHATLYCNELQLQVAALAKRPLKAGQAVSKDDFADIAELRLFDNGGNEIVIPADSNVVWIQSVRWRKCLFYDFTMRDTAAPPRSVDMPKLFGGFYRNLLFEELYSVLEEEWEGMFKWGWFPFAWMSTEDRRKVIGFSARDVEPRPVFEEICHVFQRTVLQRIESWNCLDVFSEQALFIQKAADHYLAGDFISAIQVLYPRLEGIMRKLHLLNRPGQRAQQRTMAETVVANHDEYSVLLPSRFREYLSRFYFRAFDETAGDVPLSRNTVAHGTSLAEDYDLVKASLGFMICDQMFYFLMPMASRSPECL